MLLRFIHLEHRSSLRVLKAIYPRAPGGYLLRFGLTGPSKLTSNTFLEGTTGALGIVVSLDD